MYSKSIGKKIFRIISIILIIFIIAFVAGMLILRYQVEGESNMPFRLAKISVIESVEGIEVTNTTDKWNFNINENNDIYLYIEKNEGYGKTELIESIQIKDIVINKQTDKGEAKLYKPVKDEKKMFNNLPENEIKDIVFTGDLQSNIKEQKISNQGGIIAFRYGINNLSNYISNEAEEIDHSKFLKLTNINLEDLKTNLTFDIIISLVDGKKYQANINLDVPDEEIIENGTKGIEITDLDNIVFKRIEN